MKRARYYHAQMDMDLIDTGASYDEVPRELVNFLHFVGASLEESDKDYGDDLVSRLQESISRIKTDREIGGRYMTLEEIKEMEFLEGKAEGLAEGKSVKTLLEEGFTQEDIDFVKEILQMED